jgi:cytochrome c5
MVTYAVNLNEPGEGDVVRMIRIFKLGAVFALMAAAVLGGCGGKKAAEAGAAPAEAGGPPAAAETPAPGASAASAASAESEPPGKALLEARCTVCHNLNRVRKRKETREGWEKIVAKMKKKGAVLDDAERESLLKYLTATYGK